MVSLVVVDPASIIANRNASVGINIYIGFCAILAIFIWFKKQNPVLPNTIFNQTIVPSNTKVKNPLWGLL